MWVESIWETKPIRVPTSTLFLERGISSYEEDCDQLCAFPADRQPPHRSAVLLYVRQHCSSLTLQGKPTLIHGTPLRIQIGKDKEVGDEDRI